MQWLASQGEKMSFKFSERVYLRKQGREYQRKTSSWDLTYMHICKGIAVYIYIYLDTYAYKTCIHINTKLPWGHFNVGLGDGGQS